MTTTTTTTKDWKKKWNKKQNKKVQQKEGTDYSATKYQIVFLVPCIPAYLGLKFCGKFPTKK